MKFNQEPVRISGIWLNKKIKGLNLRGDLVPADFYFSKRSTINITKKFLIFSDLYMKHCDLRCSSGLGRENDQMC